VLGVILLRARVSWEAHAFISWFGPRGLNSLLLALLVVQAGVPGAELLLAVVGVVVLASVAIHGVSASTISVWYTKHAREETLVEEWESTAAGLFAHDEGDIPRVTPEELDEMLRGSTPPIVLDVRSRSSYDSDGA
jgi:NhaP-type Na+/H+ or K+/H+ antiporter